MRSTTWVAGGRAGAEYQVDTADRFGAVDWDEWDAVVARQGLPVFYSRAFLTAYERHPLASLDAFAYLTVRQAGEPVLVLPAYLHRDSDPLGCLASAFPEAAGQPALLSHAWHCYDAQLGDAASGPMVVATMTELRRVARELGVRWCGLVNVRSDGATAAALAAAGLPLRPLTQRFTADLGGVASLDQHLAARARPRAGLNLRRYRRRAAEHGVSCTVVTPAEADLAGIVALCDRLASRNGTNRFYPAEPFQSFVAALGPAAVVLEIRQRGRLVAAGVCLVDPSRFHCWAAGADYQVDGNFSPYSVLFAETMELALRLGRPVLEGGRGNPAFKLRHGLTARRLDACLVAA